MLRYLLLMLGLCTCATACSHTASVREEMRPEQSVVGSPPIAPQPTLNPQTLTVQQPAPNLAAAPQPPAAMEPDPAYKQVSYSKNGQGALAAAPPTPVPAQSLRPVETATTMPVPVPEKASPPAEEAPVLAALRAYLNGRPAEALAALRPYDKTSQELLILLLPLIARASEGGFQSGKPAEYSYVVQQLERVADRLRPRAELTIEKMCFCSKFQSFGIYLPILESPRFEAGERVNLYVELKNFTSKWEENRYKIYHKSTLTFLDFDGKPVTFTDSKGRSVSRLPILEEQPDPSRSLRHDFAYYYGFQIPHLLPNYYTLVLQVSDVPTGRSAERTLDFQVRHPVGQ